MPPKTINWRTRGLGQRSLLVLSHWQPVCGEPLDTDCLASLKDLLR
jgi:hypothetical protein